MLQNVGIDLIFQDSILTEDEYFNMVLSYLPKGPLYEAFSIIGKEKYIWLKSVVKGEYQAYLLDTQFIKNLNFATADEDGLLAWEEVCGLEKAEFTIVQRKINVAINIGLVRNITTIQELASFISNTLGLFYIKWRYAGGEGTDGFNYQLNFTDYGGYGRRQGIIWTLNSALIQNNKNLKYFLDKMSIQTQVNFYEDENGRELLFTN